jgi:hypothetical protein
MKKLTGFEIEVVPPQDQGTVTGTPAFSAVNLPKHLQRLRAAAGLALAMVRILLPGGTRQDSLSIIPNLPPKQLRGRPMNNRYVFSLSFGPNPCFLSMSPPLDGINVVFRLSDNTTIHPMVRLDPRKSEMAVLPLRSVQTSNGPSTCKTRRKSPGPWKRQCGT